MQDETVWIVSLLGLERAVNGADGADSASHAAHMALPSAQDSLLALAKPAAEFGWRVTAVSGLSELMEVLRLRRIVAVLFNPDELSGRPEDLQRVLAALPRARLIVCTRPASLLIGPQPDAYSSLMLPLDEREVRQTLGFLWATLGAAEKQVSRKGALSLVRTAA